MKKENKSITELNWWKIQSTSRGLPKDHPILIRENDASTDRKVIKEKADPVPKDPEQRGVPVPYQTQKFIYNSVQTYKIKK